MSSCPSGHRSTTTDFCDVCGLRLQAYPPPVPAPRRAPPTPPSARPRTPGRTVVEPRGGPCPGCATPRTGRFCEECGYDFASRSGGHRHGGAGVDPGRAHWRAVVAADPAYYQYMADQGRLDPSLLPFPKRHVQRRVTLAGDRVHIGRRSVSRNFTPEIDLGGPGGDPAVSHVHAILVARPEGSWALMDPGSTNGTTVNGATDPLTPNVEVPLHDNDRIYVGAWTVIILQKG
ncbi:FHA domain-containing protein [Nocardiopsis sp. ATB16-24]|uniref:FHA domain-containing protein n=1 Tax=Nocardiopsis sp. ATB16-24 TaxID=3019555 RepID=UPI002552A8F6|nr:FHA domain-containing protein [Nocardiopsis sp. ATB16-24]